MGVKLAIVGVAVFMAGCKVSCSAGGGVVVARGTLEKQVQTWLDQLGGVVAKASCSEDIPAKVGASATCTVDVDGERHDVVLSITSVTKDKWQGDVNWKDGRGVINNRKLEEQVEAQFFDDFGERVQL